ncbi:hypothetical protein [Nonomuraea sp. NPDC049784]|uniref:hypothetical protein n=1 Tax=Nonomuraea sp. NPDC049784 TaxID=3154361 RepID=UPI0033CEB2DE
MLARGAGARAEFYGQASTDLSKEVHLSNGRRTFIGSGMGVRGTSKVKLGRAGVIASLASCPATWETINAGSGSELQCTPKPAG